MMMQRCGTQLIALLLQRAHDDAHERVSTLAFVQQQVS